MSPLVTEDLCVTSIKINKKVSLFFSQARFRGFAEDLWKHFHRGSRRLRRFRGFFYRLGMHRMVRMKRRFLVHTDMEGFNDLAFWRFRVWFAPGFQTKDTGLPDDGGVILARRLHRFRGFF